ncbi:MAG: branched-chain amino acid ABC transporter permease [Hyphomicrobiales bacterium]|nr:branched-chain amino acid ABC transporter permease [Hyphomicrobiales bacterium]
MLLSGNPPRGKLLTALIVLIVAALAFAPFILQGSKPLNVAATICVFALLVASYDVLLGYAGIVSFAHTMFFGIGAYGVAIALYGLGPSWTSILIGLLAALLVAGVLALAIGLFSLRVQTIFFAMVTLAVASAFAVGASQLSWLTGGEDGRTFSTPALLRPGYRLVENGPFGVEINGRTLTYYLVFFGVVFLFLLLLRIVESPFGRVLQAIRENPFRSEALGYRIVVHRTAAVVIGALFAACAGALNAIWLRYTGPDTTLSFSIMLDILVMVVIGGMGTLYGAIVGAAVFVVAQNYLQALMGVAFKAINAAGLPFLAGFFNPDRWLLWLGLLFILSVYFFPTGIVGKLRAETK